MQVLGALSDTQRFETTLTLSFVGSLDNIREGVLKSRLARHLKVSIADISLRAAVSSEFTQSGAMATAGHFTGMLM